jgi:[ribosomal protein S18]-alanine N-acetyltransferase
VIAKSRRRERLQSFVIAGMSMEDIPAVLEIENASFPTPWSESAFRYELLENPYASLFVARTRGPAVIAFASVWIVDQEMKVNNIAVHPQFRLRGVGTRFLTFLLRYAEGQGCRDMTLEVRPSNDVALHLYTKSGFSPVGRRKQYYTDTHEDAIVMWRRIEPRAQI